MSSQTENNCDRNHYLLLQLLTNLCLEEQVAIFVILNNSFVNFNVAINN
ncbi:MAG: hypothetical protein V7K21_14240 [Nostoc sp.]